MTIDYINTDDNNRARAMTTDYVYTEDNRDMTMTTDCQHRG